MAYTVGPWPVTDERIGTAVLTTYYTPTANAARNRIGVQTVLDRIAPSGLGKGAKLFVPPRWDGDGNPDPIVVNRDGSNAWCLDIPSNTMIEGAGRGSGFKLADSQATSTRLLRVQGRDHVTIRNLKLDGNRTNNDTSFEQNHCLFIYDSSDVLVEDVETVDATGDGISISGTTAKSRRIVVNRVISTGHKRNPVTVEQVDDCWITNSYLIAASDSGGQAIDSEPFSDVITGRLYILGNIIGHDNSSADYCLTFSGRSATYPRRGVQIIGNDFRGRGINGQNAENVVIANNTGAISKLYSIGYSRRVDVLGNTWDCDSATYAVDVQFTGSNIPTGWQISDNVLTVAAGGMNFQGVDDLGIRGGRIYGAGTSQGIRCWSTRATKNWSIQETYLNNFAKGIYCTRSSTNTHDGLFIGGNTIDTTSGIGIDLESSANWLSNVALGPNQMKSVTGGKLGINTATPYLMAGVQGMSAIYSVNGTPEGALTAPIGSLAFRRDGGASTTMYLKETGTSNTGWRAV